MAKLKVGDQMPDFTFDTPFESGCTLEDVVKKAPKTALLFLRYYGCTLCQLDLRQLAKHYEEICAGGGRFLVVLQSEPETISAQIQKGDLPFEIICDPQQELYHKFEIEAAESMAAMADARALMKLAKAAACGIRHGKYEGNEQQLPAAFIMDRQRRLNYVKYAKTLSDMPEIKELCSLLA